MAKKSKKKASKSRTSSSSGGQPDAAAAAAAAPPPSSRKLNPFYIEQYQQQQQPSTWEGDYHWNHNNAPHGGDDQDEEQAGLLGRAQPQHPHDYDDEHDSYYYDDAYDDDDPTALPRRRRRRSSTTTTRVLVAAGLLTIVFWVLLSKVDRRESPTNKYPPTAASTNTTTNHPGWNHHPQSAPSSQDDDDDEDDHAKPAVVDDDDADDRNTNGDGDADDDDATGGLVDVVVLGERHSGVDWLMEELKACYYNDGNEAAVRVMFGRSRPGYWFQEEEDARDESAGGDDDDVIVIRTNSLVVLNMVRDPYDWLREMWQHPLYMPAHQHQEGAAAATPLDLREFVTKAWTIDENNYDHETITSEKDDALCQFGFLPDQVVPCLNASTVDVLDKNTPVYELDPTTGLVFPNIMALRAAKLRHQLDEIPKLWHVDDISDDGDDGASTMFVVHYETGLTDEVLGELRKRTPLSMHCRGMAPPRDDETDEGNYNLPMQFWQWMRNHTDWELEARLGYAPRDDENGDRNTTTNSEP